MRRGTTCMRILLYGLGYSRPGEKHMELMSLCSFTALWGNQNQEIKVRSIRANEATLDKFKSLSSEFESQGDCLSQLITAYEISNAKHILTDVKADIADYESHINSIQQAFLHVLELNSNAEKRIRQEFNDLLCSKDSQIISLQERADKTEHELENANNIYQQNMR